MAQIGTLCKGDLTSSNFGVLQNSITVSAMVRRHGSCGCLASQCMGDQLTVMLTNYDGSGDDDDVDDGHPNRWPYPCLSSNSYHVFEQA